MKLELHNVGKFESAAIDVDGFTVIAGANATGKSTLSKALYCLFNGFSFRKDVFRAARKAAILQALGDLPRRLSTDDEAVGDRLSDELLSLKAVNADAVRTFITDFSRRHAVHRFIAEHDIYGEGDSDEVIDVPGDAPAAELSAELPLDASVIQQILRILSLDKTSFRKIQIGNLLDQEFRGQIADTRTENASSVLSLIVQNQTLSVGVENGRLTSFEAPLRLTKQAVYIDDPFVVDDAARLRRQASDNICNLSHREALRQLLTCRKANTLLDNLRTADHEALLAKIAAVCAGRLTEDAAGRLLYQENGNKPLDIFNVSTGLKTFVIIRHLLINGAFEKNGTVILDEPEIHLHPQWQVVLVEVLVLLQKEFNLHILLTTHSPYFLRALEVFTQKHDIRSKCRFYRTGIADGSATVTDVTDSVDTIYKEMARPFQTLENLLYADA